MFHVERHGPNRMDLTLAGKLDAEAMRNALDAMITESGGIEHGRMLYRIQDFDIPTFGAMAVEMSRLPMLLRLVQRFDRVAVLANKEWIKRVSEIEGALIPGLRIKAFDPDHEQQALTWLEAA